MGYLDPPEINYPMCPICGNECDTLYFDMNDQICGCDCCISSQNAFEYEEDRREAAMEAEAERRVDMFMESRYGY